MTSKSMTSRPSLGTGYYRLNLRVSRKCNQTPSKGKRRPRKATGASQDQELRDNPSNPRANITDQTNEGNPVSNGQHCVLRGCNYDRSSPDEYYHWWQHDPFPVPENIYRSDVCNWLHSYFQNLRLQQGRADSTRYTYGPPLYESTPTTTTTAANAVASSGINYYIH